MLSRILVTFLSSSSFSFHSWVVWSLPCGRQKLLTSTARVRRAAWVPVLLPLKLFNDLHGGGVLGVQLDRLLIALEGELSVSVKQISFTQAIERVG